MRKINYFYSHIDSNNIQLLNKQYQQKMYRLVTYNIRNFDISCPQRREMKEKQ